MIIKRGLTLWQWLNLLPFALISFASCAALGETQPPPSGKQWDDRALAYWSQANDSNKQAIDHGRWQMLLDRYLDAQHVSGIHRFDYLRVTQDDRARLQAYLQAMQQIDPLQYASQVQMAYWINVYNALTVEVVLDRKPSVSILSAGKGLFARGPWDEPLIEVNAWSLSLDDIEHNILRPIWSDPRLHFAVNCASLGCPNLQPQVFSGERIDLQLANAAREYLAHPRGLSWKKDRLYLSSLFKWYRDDFGDTEREMLATLAGYVDPQQAALLSKYTAKVRYRYSWRLNKP